MFRKILAASRPATLSVSILSTFLGMIVAYRQGYIFRNYPWDIWRIFLIASAALLLQSAVNMMNNYFEEDASEEILKSRDSYFLRYKRSREEILYFKVGIMFYIVCAAIGLYLFFCSGVQLLLIEIAGAFFAYAYAGEPFSYKKYGLGVPMSFIMMGPLMAYASYYIFSKAFSAEPVIYSFTLGLYIPAILLANELRDYEEDNRRGIGTLTVRIGYSNGKALYFLLLLFSYINTIILAVLKFIPAASIIVLSTIPLMNKIIKTAGNNRKQLIPETARLYLIFSIEIFSVLVLFK
ncbi:MAG: prenyltransferase [Bacillota bacterium]|nr:prenyltransferase [Bacillota bacterium]